jgi:molybdopterin-binding protein
LLASGLGGLAELPLETSNLTQYSSEYRHIRRTVCRPTDLIGAISMKISARNILKGEIIEIMKGRTTSHVKIDIGSAVVTSSITNEAVDDLRLAPGRTAYAVVKASETS